MTRTAKPDIGLTREIAGDKDGMWLIVRRAGHDGESRFALANDYEVEGCCRDAPGEIVLAFDHWKIPHILMSTDLAYSLGQTLVDIAIKSRQLEVDLEPFSL